jgi:hypothetical protein
MKHQLTYQAEGVHQQQGGGNRYSVYVDGRRLELQGQPSTILSCRLRRF